MLFSESDTLPSELKCKCNKLRQYGMTLLISCSRVQVITLLRIERVDTINPLAIAPFVHWPRPPALRVLHSNSSCSWANWQRSLNRFSLMGNVRWKGFQLNLVIRKSQSDLGLCYLPSRQTESRHSKNVWWVLKLAKIRLEWRGAMDIQQMRNPIRDIAPNKMELWSNCQRWCN